MDDPFQHWQAAASSCHPSLQPSSIDPSLELVYSMSHAFQGDLHRWRHEVLLDLQAMVEDMHDETAAWYGSLPEHCAKAYKVRPFEDDTSTTTTCPLPWPRPWPALPRMAQVPVLLRILEWMGFPDVLSQEMSFGFPMIGPLTPGTGWHPRSDEKY